MLYFTLPRCFLTVGMNRCLIKRTGMLSDEVPGFRIVIHILYSSQVVSTRR